MRYFGLLMFPAKTLHASYRYRAELPTTPQLGCIHTYLYDLPTVICIYTYFVVVLNFEWPFQTQRQPRLEHTYIEVRKARYIYMWYKQSEMNNIKEMNSFVSNSGISQGPTQREVVAAQDRLTHLPDTEEWNGQLWSIYNDEMLLGFRVKTKLDLVQCRIVHESAAYIYISRTARSAKSRLAR